jgi:O-Antigen ligase
MSAAPLTARATSAAAHDRLASLAGLVGVGVLALGLGWLVGHGRATLTAAAVLALLIVVPIVRDPRRGLLWGALVALVVPASETFVGGKLDVIRIAGALVLLAVALDIYNHPRIKHLSVVDWSVAAFCAVGIGGWLFEPQPPHGSAFAINYLLPLAFYLGARRFGRHAEPLLVVVFVGASLASLTVIYEALFVHRPLFADPTSYYWSATSVYIFRPGGVFGGPPQAASVLAMSMFCGFPLLGSARGLKRLGAGLCFGASLAALILTFARGPIIGFALGVIAFGVLLGPATWARYAYAGGALALVVVAVLLPSIGTTPWFEKGVLRGGTLSARQVVWSQTGALITDSTAHELFGHGTNSIVIGTPWLPGTPPTDIAEVPALTQAGAQDQYIRTLLEGGIAGFLLMLGWVFGAAAKGIAASFRHSRERRAIAALTAACVAFAVAALVDDALRQSQTAVTLALVTGLLVSLSSAGKGAHEPWEPDR